jgi:Family of unknown function (DUF6445)
MKSITIEIIGKVRTPVIVIDHFTEAPQQLVEDAAMLGFQPIGPYYPGVRASVPPALVASFTQTLDALMAETFTLWPPFEILESYYSLVTTPPEALAPIQRLPHFDSVEPQRIALLHYLSPAEQGGTAFFRHRATDYERVTGDRMQDYAAALEADVKAHGLPPARYIKGDTSIFEQIGHVQAKYNRAIIYPGNLLHCADIPAGMNLSADPMAGRLTVNTFLQGQVA